MRIRLLYAIVLVLAACGSDDEPPSNARAAAAYLEDALRVMEARSLFRSSVDWASLRKHARARASSARTAADTYAAIGGALEDIGDSHSVFVPPEAMSAWENAVAAENPEPKVWRENDIGFVMIPGHDSGNVAECERYATRLQRRLHSISSVELHGWIVDLRFNGGGNMWPMIAGLAPLLREGKIGAFVAPEREVCHWIYADGTLTGEEGFTIRVSEGTYEIADNRPIAVLVGPRTASSGEAVAIAFKGLDRVRLFGLPTAGLTTSNELFKLSDGAALFLTTSRFADRTGRVYSGPIIPDFIVEEDSQENRTLETATRWLRSH